MTTTAVSPAEEFKDFYQANFADTVMLVYSYTADLPAAQDVAQEAFARAWQRWQAVSDYENPAAWVRRVCVNLTNSRWRRLRTARSYLDRQRDEHAEELSEDHVAVVAALRKLPRNHREAIVLHYIADMPVDEVARQLGVPAGTVKSWLHRGRAMLAGQLTVELPAFVTPPAQEAMTLGRKRQRAQLAVVTASAAFVVILTLAAAAAVRQGASQAPVAPATSAAQILPAGCQPGDIPVSLILPDEEGMRVTVLDPAGASGEAVADELRYRKMTVVEVRSEPESFADEVAVIRFGPKGVGAAHVIQAYTLNQARTVFQPDRQAAEIDLVIGGKFKQLATPAEMRQALAMMGKPPLPAGTCEIPAS